MATASEKITSSTTRELPHYMKPTRGRDQNVKDVFSRATYKSKSLPRKLPSQFVAKIQSRKPKTPLTSKVNKVVSRLTQPSSSRFQQSSGIKPKPRAREEEKQPARKSRTRRKLPPIQTSQRQKARVPGRPRTKTETGIGRATSKSLDKSQVSNLRGRSGAAPSSAHLYKNRSSTRPRSSSGATTSKLGTIEETVSAKFAKGLKAQNPWTPGVSRSKNKASSSRGNTPRNSATVARRKEKSTKGKENASPQKPEQATAAKVSKQKISAAPKPESPKAKEELPVVEVQKENAPPQEPDQAAAFSEQALEVSKSQTPPDSTPPVAEAHTEDVPPQERVQNSAAPSEAATQQSPLIEEAPPPIPPESPLSEDSELDFDALDAAIETRYPTLYSTELAPVGIPIGIGAELGIQDEKPEALFLSPDEFSAVQYVLRFNSRPYAEQVTASLINKQFLGQKKEEENLTPLSVLDKNANYIGEIPFTDMGGELEIDFFEGKTDLNLSVCRYLDSDFRNVILKFRDPTTRVSYLEKATFFMCPKLTGFGLQRLKDCPLKYFHLSACEKVDQESLIAVIKSCSNTLEVVELPEQALSPALIEALSNCKKLRKLDLSYCSFANVSLKPLANIASSLEIFDVTGADSLSLKELTSLAPDKNNIDVKGLLQIQRRSSAIMHAIALIAPIIELSPEEAEKKYLNAIQNEAKLIRTELQRKEIEYVLYSRFKRSSKEYLNTIHEKAELTRLFRRRGLGRKEYLERLSEIDKLIEILSERETEYVAYWEVEESDRFHYIEFLKDLLDICGMMPEKTGLFDPNHPGSLEELEAHTEAAIDFYSVICRMHEKDEYHFAVRPVLNFFATLETEALSRKVSYLNLKGLDLIRVPRILYTAVLPELLQIDLKPLEIKETNASGKIEVKRKIFNEIRKIPDLFFWRCHKLSILNLSENKVNFLGTLSKWCPHLEHLILNSNQITSPMDMIEGYSKIKKNKPKPPGEAWKPSLQIQLYKNPIQWVPSALDSRICMGSDLSEFQSKAASLGASPRRWKSVLGQNKFPQVAVLVDPSGAA